MPSGRVNKSVPTLIVDEDQFFPFSGTGVPHSCRVLYARFVQIAFLLCGEKASA